MKFAIGSKSERKITSVTKVITSMLYETTEVVGFSASSHVPETPWDKETYDGARNRALSTKDGIDADYYIGLESGLVERYDNVYEEAWCCVITKEGMEYFGFSSGLKVPDYILGKMQSLNLPHSEIMAMLEDEHNLSKSDTWGIYSGNKILRDVSLEEALRNTLIQVFSSEESFYEKV